MSLQEPKLRLTIAAVGIAMAVTSPVLILMLLPHETVGVRVMMIGTTTMPLLWCAAAVLFRSPRPSEWRRFLGWLIGGVYVASGIILVIGVAAVSGRASSIDFLAVAFSLPLCIHVPVGLICLSVLLLMGAKRLFREPPADGGSV